MFHFNPTISGAFRYLTKIIGKYAFGSCGASGARSGTQRLKGVGGVGGSADVEYALRAALIVPIASDKLSCCAGTEGTDASSGPDGAATLCRNGQMVVPK